MAIDQRVIVTYSAPSTFLQSDSWQQFFPTLKAQLPLHNLHWKSASRPSIRTIQELQIDLVPLEAAKDEPASQIPTTLLERPLLNVYVVICEDAETYKSSIRKQLKDWHTSVSPRKHQDWLIIHLLRPDARASSSGFFAVRSSVLDKIKADFNTDKRDRCVQLPWSQGQDNPAAWAEAVNKLKEGILFSFDSAVIQREEDVRRSESQRQMPGWNFCTYFILKESVATSFEGVNLPDEALAQYDQLELSFFQVLKEKSLSWFGKLIDTDTSDDSLPLLAIDKKPYRDMILANTISIFDFRVYLLARQCLLLGKSGRVIEVARKTGAFLSTFGQRLREAKELPRFFLQSWIYLSSLSVVRQCDQWASNFELEPAATNRFNAAKAELQELARKQLDVLGIAYGHLPSRPPFISITSEDSRPADESVPLPRAFENMKDRDAFYDMYVSNTNRAIDLYAKAARKKFALKLHGDLAALDLHRGRFSHALQTYTSLPAHYSNYKWTSLESFMVSCQISARELQGKMSDREWVHTVLSYLKVYVEDMSKSFAMSNEDRAAHINKLIQSLGSAASELMADIPYSDHKAFEISTNETRARLAETEDGLYVLAVVENKLPCPVDVDEITITLAGRETEKLRFTTGGQTLKPGRNEVELFCPTPSCGLHVLESSQIKLSRVVLQWAYRQQDRISRPGLSATTLIDIPEDLQAVDVQLHQPRRVELGLPQHLLLTITTGRNEVVQATLKLSSTSGVTFTTAEAVVDNNDSISIATSDDSLTLVELDEDSSVSLAIPHSDTSGFSSMVVQVHLEYVTKSNPSLVRSVNFVRTLTTALPLQVNVQDFFRGTQLTSRFTVSTTSQQYLRVLSAELKLDDSSESDGINVIRPPITKRSATTVTPGHPTNYLFRISSPGGPVRQRLRLHLMFRTLDEEIEAVVHHIVEEATTNSIGLQHHREELTKKVCADVRTRPEWEDRYRVTRNVEVDIEANPEDPKDVKDIFTHICQTLTCGSFDPEVGSWREMVIPVEVPYMDILATVRVRILSSPLVKAPTYGDGASRYPIYAGQPISAELSVTTSFHWSNDRKPGQTYRMRFDVEELVRDWLVSGRKRGDFVAKDGASYTVPFTLIALHHGELPLPTVTITPMMLDNETGVEGAEMSRTVLPSIETHQEHGAERVLVLPRGGRSTFVVGMGGNQYD